MLNFNEKIAPLSGWLTIAEGTFLYDRAKEVAKGHAIVEIGSWKGKSTICLGKGAQEGNNAKVYAVDPHTGSPEHQAMFNHPVDTYQEFLENIKTACVDQVIVPIRKTSKDAAVDFDQPIGLLFIDGDHDFQAVKLDYELWFPKVANGGVIALHDTWHFPGPHKLTAGMLFTSSTIASPRLIDTITCFTKVEKNSIAQRIYNIGFFFYRLAVGKDGFLRLKNHGSVVK